MKRILITGGAGSIGGQVTRSLAERGNSVRVFDLPICDFGPLEALDGVDILPGDITDPAIVRAAVDGVDVVLHLAALLPPVSERNRDKTYAVNVLGTKNVVEAIAAADDPARLIFSSTVATYGNTVDDVIRLPALLQHAQDPGRGPAEAAIEGGQCPEHPPHRNRRGNQHLPGAHRAEVLLVPG